jgi:hypothetical protein
VDHIIGEISDHRVAKREPIPTPPTETPRRPATNEPEHITPIPVPRSLRSLEGRWIDSDSFDRVQINPGSGLLEFEFPPLGRATISEPVGISRSDIVVSVEGAASSTGNGGRLQPETLVAMDRRAHVR